MLGGLMFGRGTAEVSCFAGPLSLLRTAVGAPLGLVWRGEGRGGVLAAGGTLWTRQRPASRPSPLPPRSPVGASGCSEFPPGRNCLLSCWPLKPMTWGRVPLWLESQSPVGGPLAGGPGAAPSLGSTFGPRWNRAVGRQLGLQQTC